MQYSLSDVFMLFGSLGLFLYGMKVLSDALLELAGDKMRSFLAKATSNKFLAILTGFGITALIQSSSATTLMVVSFANASLLSLTESIGVIMGANIGTTVTAWLIALLGFKIKLSAFSIPLVGIGFLFTFSEKKNLRNWGLFIIGFALLFLGLQFLKEAVPDLKAHPEALTFLQEYTQLGFKSVLLFLFIGMLLTVVIQSSSAAMAITIIMCFEGWIPFNMAAAMVLGQNIGTTITANIAALVANHHAKRTARAHMIFNLAGTIWMVVLFYPFLEFIDKLTIYFEGSSPFTRAAVIPVALSIYHTTFNIINTLVLVNFIERIAKYAERMVPAVPEKHIQIERPHFLDSISMKFPSSGIKALLDESLRLFEHTTFKVITHGLHVHREVFESDVKLKKILSSVEKIELDVDDIYLRKVKTIYGEIVAYATEMQSKFEMDEDEIKLIRGILRADRLIVDVVKVTKPLHENMYLYLNGDNKHIKKEYNRLRKLILKILRLSRAVMDDGELKSKNVKKYHSLKSALEKYDALQNGTVEKLIRNELIDNTMATSLMNDSALTIGVAERLIDISSLLYLQKDIFYDEGNGKIPAQEELEPVPAS